MLKKQRNKCTCITYISTVPPEIRLPNKRIGQVQKKETILDCIVTAYPQAVSVWKFKGRELSKSTKHNVEVFNEGDHKITLSLRIKDIGEEDYGLYTCVASNSMGRTSKRMELYGKKSSKSVTIID